MWRPIAKYALRLNIMKQWVQYGSDAVLCQITLVRHLYLPVRRYAIGGISCYPCVTRLSVASRHCIETAEQYGMDASFDLYDNVL